MSFRRHLADYGMVLALLLLCAFFSVVTWSEQHPTGEAAGRGLAREIAGQFGEKARVLVVVRAQPEDAAFAEALRAQLPGAEVVKGEPRDARAALQRLAAGGKLDAIACTQSTAAWLVFQDLATDFPALGAPRVMTPRSSAWPNFLKADNLLNIANQIAVIAIIAVGMTIVIITAGIDLSVGSLLALSAVLAALFIRDFGGGVQAGALAMTLCCLAAILACGLMGAFSGAMITLFGVPPFIATLGMMLVGSGLAYLLARGESVYQVPDSFVWLGRGAGPIGLPNAVLLMLALYAAAHVLMSRMKLGRYVYAVGGNREAARLSGVPVLGVLLLAYTVSGLLAGVGGVVMASQLKSGSPMYGQMYELYVIAAVVVGGTSLSGGEGKMFGTLIGAFIIAVIQNGMNLTNVESYTQKVVLGLVILAAVLLDRLKQRGWRIARGAVVLLAVSSAHAAEEPIASWKVEGAQRLVSTELAGLRGDGFTLRARLATQPKSGDVLARQTPDRRSGFRLFVEETKAGRALSFELAFDWKHARNNRPLKVGAPLSRTGAEPGNDVLVRFAGPKLDLFIDGVLVDEEWPVGGIAHAAQEPLTIAQAATVQLWDRALVDAEVVALSGGAEAVARREREILGPELPVGQYWKPRGHNTGVGDCMPFFHAGRFHLFYLFDRHGHGAKWGLGAHQWAHVSSADLKSWTHHPMAVPITDAAEGSICTGSVFAHDGLFHAFYAVRTADGSPARLTAARSRDGVHFEKSDWSVALGAPYQGPPARDPVVLRDPETGRFHMLVTTELLQPAIAGHGGCLARLESGDLKSWESRPPFLVPGFGDQPECPDWFEWNGWHYLVFSNHGVARYRVAKSAFGPWHAPRVDVFDGPQARVLKTAAFHGGRRLGAAFLPRAGAGYAGHLVLREIVQNDDGSLRTRFVPELAPALGAKIESKMTALTDDVAGDANHLKITAASGLGVGALDGLPPDFRLKLRITPEPTTAAFGVCVRGSGAYAQGHELRFEPDRQKAGWRPTRTSSTDEHEGVALYDVEGLEREFIAELIVTGDILDVCIDDRRTLIVRAPSALTGDRLFLFAQNGSATFEVLELNVLAP